MFGNKDKTEKNGLKSEIERLEKEVRAAKDELADVKHKKKLEEEDIKHMVKMTQEKKDIELEKEKAKLEREKDAAIAKVKDDYRDKMEERLQTEVSNIKEMYTEVLARLPNVTANLKGNINA